MNPDQDPVAIIYLKQQNFYLKPEESSDFESSTTSMQSNISCDTLQGIHYASSIGASLVYLLAMFSSVISLVIWSGLLKGGSKKRAGIGRKRPTTMTPLIFRIIECMNIAVYTIQYLRHVLPAIIISILLTPVKGCKPEDFIKAMPYQWHQILSVLWWVSYPPEQALIIAHQWIHLLLSYERFMFLCQPFRAWSKCSKKRMQMYLWTIIIASFLAASPYVSEYRILFGANFGAKESCTEVVRTRTRMHPCYTFFYRFLFHILFKYTIPWVIIIYHTVYIRKVLKNMDQVNQDDLETTYMDSPRSSRAVDRLKNEHRCSSVSSATSFTSDITASASGTPKSERKVHSEQISIKSNRTSKEHHLDRASYVSLAQLNKVSDTKNQKNITYLCYAILSVFFFCQLPSGIWLSVSGLDNLYIDLEYWRFKNHEIFL